MVGMGQGSLGQRTWDGSGEFGSEDLGWVRVRVRVRVSRGSPFTRIDRRGCCWALKKEVTFLNDGAFIDNLHQDKDCL